MHRLFDGYGGNVLVVSRMWGGVGGNFGVSRNGLNAVVGIMTFVPFVDFDGLL